MDEIMECLIKRGCRDMTLDLDPASDNNDIARGGFGTIYSGRLRDGTLVALKCLEVLTNPSWIDENYSSNLKRTARELYTWSKCDHPGVLPLLGMARFRGCIAMVSPLMPMGQLGQYVIQNPSIDCIELSIQIAEALGYLHDRKIVHGDVKAANILVSKGGQLKLADFGNAVARPSTLEITPMSSCYSIRWAAPEILDNNGGEHTVPADVYALAMTILELITRKPPYVGKTEVGVMCAVLRKEHPPRPQFDFLLGNEELNDRLWLLLVRCWSYEPEDRPSALQVKDELNRIKSRVKEMTH
ncbi:kinase-like protein [Ceratobasidium sp. AG-I]|nr:kinase-like protein [Ceratobasidium sp. AG-I]